MLIAGLVLEILLLVKSQSLQAFVKSRVKEAVTKSLLAVEVCTFVDTVTGSELALYIPVFAHMVNGMILGFPSRGVSDISHAANTAVSTITISVIQFLLI